MTTASPAVKAWTCARCKVRATWAPGSEVQGRPATWTEDGDRLFCLTCQRALAAEAAAFAAPADTSTERRAKLRSAAMVEFEIRRDPDRSNGEIARSIRSSVPAVAKARLRLGVAPPTG